MTLILLNVMLVTLNIPKFDGKQNSDMPVHIQQNLQQEE